jgi:hypothetical protein
MTRASVVSDAAFVSPKSSAGPQAATVNRVTNSERRIEFRMLVSSAKCQLRVTSRRKAAVSGLELFAAREPPRARRGFDTAVSPTQRLHNCIVDGSPKSHPSLCSVRARRAGCKGMRFFLPWFRFVYLTYYERRSLTSSRTQVLGISRSSCWQVSASIEETPRPHRRSRCHQRTDAHRNARAVRQRRAFLTKNCASLPSQLRSSARTLTLRPSVSAVEALFSARFGWESRGWRRALLTRRAQASCPSSLCAGSPSTRRASRVRCQ